MPTLPWHVNGFLFSPTTTPVSRYNRRMRSSSTEIVIASNCQACCHLCGACKILSCQSPSLRLWFQAPTFIGGDLRHLWHAPIFLSLYDFVFEVVKSVFMSVSLERNLNYDFIIVFVVFVSFFNYLCHYSFYFYFTTNYVSCTILERTFCLHQA